VAHAGIVQARLPQVDAERNTADIAGFSSQFVLDVQGW